MPSPGGLISLDIGVQFFECLAGTETRVKVFIGLELGHHRLVRLSDGQTHLYGVDDG